MGMFDPPEYPDWLETKFPRGSTFKIDAIGLGNKINGQFGEQQIVLVVVGGTEYACTGTGFEQQARQMKPSDLPAFVQIEDIPTGNGTNKVKRFVKVEA